jgi:hypothetical protein
MTRRVGKWDVWGELLTGIGFGVLLARDGVAVVVFCLGFGITRREVA